jgi:hypothetical protein
VPGAAGNVATPTGAAALDAVDGTAEEELPRLFASVDPVPSTGVRTGPVAAAGKPGRPSPQRHAASRRYADRADPAAPLGLDGATRGVGLTGNGTALDRLAAAGELPTIGRG